MRYYIDCFTCIVVFAAAFFAGALHPVLGWITLAVWLFVCLPRLWRSAIVHNAEVDRKRRKMNIETQIIRGKLDAQLIAETADEMKRSGRL